MEFPIKDVVMKKDKDLITNKVNHREGSLTPLKQKLNIAIENFAKPLISCRHFHSNQDSPQNLNQLKLKGECTFNDKNYLNKKNQLFYNEIQENAISNIILKKQMSISKLKENRKELESNENNMSLILVRINRKGMKIMKKK